MMLKQNTFRNTKFTDAFLLITGFSFVVNAFAQTQKKTSIQNNSAYLFAYFTGNKGDEESIRFEISKDEFSANT